MHIHRKSDGKTSIIRALLQRRRLWILPWYEICFEAIPGSRDADVPLNG
jgi:hypothetical protein